MSHIDYIDMSMIHELTGNAPQVVIGVQDGDQPRLVGMFPMACGVETLAYLRSEYAMHEAWILERAAVDCTHMTNNNGDSTVPLFVVGTAWAMAAKEDMVEAAAKLCNIASIVVAGVLSDKRFERWCFLRVVLLDPAVIPGSNESSFTRLRIKLDVERPHAEPDKVTLRIPPSGLLSAFLQRTEAGPTVQLHAHSVN